MVTVRRTTLVVLLAGVALLMAMLMFGGAQGAAPGTAQAAPAKSSHATAKSNKSKAARSHQARAKSHRAAVRASRTAATTEQESTSETESGTEPPGEPADGYEDPAGQDVQHECPPACGPGEKG
jgi:dihydrodipicolinate synthase/N-acetylneuraminate lyase